MDPIINELGERIKEELEKSSQAGGFRGIAETLKNRFSELAVRHLTFVLNFDARIIDNVHEVTVLRFPLAQLITMPGIRQPISDEILRLKRTVEERGGQITPEEQKRLLDLRDEGMKNPSYSVAFGVNPSLADQKISVCKSCHGSGYHLETFPKKSN